MVRSRPLRYKSLIAHPSVTVAESFDSAVRDMIDLCAWLLVCVCALANAQVEESEFPLWRTITGEGQERPPSERFIGRSSGTRLLVSKNDFSLPFHPFLPPVAIPDQPGVPPRNTNKLQYVWHPVHSFQSTPSGLKFAAPRPWATLPTPTTTTPQPRSLSLVDLYYKHGQGEWSLWSQWSTCVNNQRMRARGCYRARSTRCPGSNMEKQKCTGGIAVDADGDRPIADPWKEEREQAAAQLGI